MATGRANSSMRAHGLATAVRGTATEDIRSSGIRSGNVSKSGFDVQGNMGI